MYYKGKDKEEIKKVPFDWDIDIIRTQRDV